MTHSYNIMLWGDASNGGPSQAQFDRRSQRTIIS